MRRWLLRLRFGSGPLTALVNPFYLARSGLARAIRDYAGRVEGRLLDVGCGSKPYREWFVRCPEYVGLDIDREDSRRRGCADVFYDGSRLPFRDHSFDVVLTTQVLEHVFTPEEFLREIARVLRPGGRLILTVPFAWDEHEQPFDFARYTSFGLRALLERNGFRVLDQRKTRCGMAAACQLAISVIYKSLPIPNRWIHTAVHAVLALPLTVAGAILGRFLRGGGDLYLDNVVLAERLDAAALGEVSRP